MQVFVDRIEDAQVSESDRQVTIARSYYICGLDTAHPENALTSALGAPGIPAIYAPHPSITLARCTKRDVKPKGDSQALVVCTYEWQRQDANSSNGIRWELGGSVQQIESSFDTDGKKLQVTYKPLGAKADMIKTVVGNIYLPSVVLRGLSYEKGPPMSKARQYVGTINSDSWAGGKPRQWMCNSITGSGVSLGTNAWWEVHYEFILREYPWVSVAVIRDIDGSVPGNIEDLGDPKSIKPGDTKNGWVAYKAAREMSFGGAFGNPPQ